MKNRICTAFQPHIHNWKGKGCGMRYIIGIILFSSLILIEFIYLKKNKKSKKEWLFFIIRTICVIFIVINFINMIKNEN